MVSSPRPADTTFEDTAYEYKREILIHTFAYQVLQLFRLRIVSNPIIQHEFIVRLRKPLSWMAFCLFLLFSNALFLIAWYFHRHETNAAVYDSRLYYIYMNLILCGLIFTFVPAMNSTAIQLEREKQTWDMLCSAPLNLLDIILGKWIASFGFFLLFLFSLLPLYGFWSVVGGIAAKDIAVMFLMIVELSFAFSLLGFLASVSAKNAIVATLSAYLLCAILFLLFVSPLIVNIYPACLSPVSMAVLWFGMKGLPFLSHYQEPGLLVIASLFHCLAFLAFLFILVLAVLYQLVKRTYSYERLTALEEMWREIRLQMQAWRPSLRFYSNDYFPDGKNPVFVREVREMFGRNGAGLVAWIVILFFSGLYILMRNTQYEMAYSGVLRQYNYRELLAIIPVCLTPFLVIPYVSYAFRKEFQQNTWSMLRATFLTPWSLVRGKLATGLFSYQIQFWAFFTLIAVSVVGVNLELNYEKHLKLELLLGTLALCFVSSVCYASFGLWCSLHHRNAFWAFLSGILFSVAWTCGYLAFAVASPFLLMNPQLFQSTLFNTIMNHVSPRRLFTFGIQRKSQNLIPP